MSATHADQKDDGRSDRPHRLRQRSNHQPRAEETRRHAASLLCAATSTLKTQPRKGRMLMKASVATATNLRDVRAVVVEAKQKNNPAARRKLVRAYKQEGRLTAVSTLPAKDPEPFLRDYFEAGGTTRNVVDWLVQVAPLCEGGATGRRSSAVSWIG